MCHIQVKVIIINKNELVSKKISFVAFKNLNINAINVSTLTKCFEFDFGAYLIFKIFF